MALEKKKIKCVIQVPVGILDTKDRLVGLVVSMSDY